MTDIASARWFRSKSRPRRGVSVIDRLPDLGIEITRVDYEDGGHELYVVGDNIADGLLRAIREGHPSLKTWHGDLPDVPPARVGSAEQSNTTAFFGDRLIMKIYRLLVQGENPEVEILRYLAKHPSVPTPRLLGEAEYRGAALAMVQTFVPSKGDAWSATLDRIARGDRDASWARRLGERTAALHRALAAGTDAAFAPEPFDASVIAASRDNLTKLVAKGRVPELAQRAEQIDARLARAANMQFATKRIRIHGDYHLGQVLVTPDDDFVIIDFEGEPARPLEERRAKSMPLRDVAGMLRSFDYAAVTAKAGAEWKRAVSDAFVNAWRAGVAGSLAAPANDEEMRALLDLYLVDKAVYEVAYELDNRPDWVSVPVNGLLSLLEG
jgi:trehalose synthase-fused probable maltokinase